MEAHVQDIIVNPAERLAQMLEDDAEAIVNKALEFQAHQKAVADTLRKAAHQHADTLVAFSARMNDAEHQANDIAASFGVFTPAKGTE
jgi:hypothetical protein